MRIGDDLLNREIQIGDKFPTAFGIFKVVEIKGDTCLCSNEYTMMLSRLVDTFFSRTSWTMLLYAENHSISVA